jgi:4-hydroxybenzoyl-CoA thioesterase/acyl-CoA thioester hydrolase
MSVSMQHDGMHVGWPRVKATCDYSGPVKFEDEVECKMTVEKIGGKSFTYNVVFSVNEKEVAKGTVTSVCCEILKAGGMRGIEIPPAIRAKLSGK